MSATKKLNLRLMEDSDIFAGETINNIVSDIDDKVLGIGHETSKIHFEKWEADKDYQADDLVRVNDIPSWGVWECVTPGTSGNTPPTGAIEEMNFNDGTVVWKLRKIVNEGVTIHNKLNGRGVNDAHPVSAITGLQALLDSLITAADAKAYTDTKIADLIDGAPATLDTLKEIADALADDDNAISAIMTILDKKVDKVQGKGLSTNDYSDVDKAKVDKIGEDTNGNFMYDNKLIVGGAEEWQPNNTYVKNQLITYKNLLYRADANFLSPEVFDTNYLDQITLGYIADWQPERYYSQYEVAIQGVSILRCVTPHTSETNFSSVEANNWETIASKGAVISAWKPNTPYGLDEAVVYEDSIYLSNSDHISGETFTGDMQVGQEKWRPLNSGGSFGELKQVTRLGMVGTQLVEIAINNTLTFNLPPVEILKFTPGLQDQIIAEFNFSAGDGEKFIIDEQSAELSEFVTFDGTVHPNNDYASQMVKVDAFTGSGQYSEDNIDDDIYKSIESVKEDYNVLVNLRVVDNAPVDDTGNSWTGTNVDYTTNTGKFSANAITLTNGFLQSVRPSHPIIGKFSFSCWIKLPTGYDANATYVVSLFAATNSSDPPANNIWFASINHPSAPAIRRSINFNASGTTAHGATAGGFLTPYVNDGLFHHFYLGRDTNNTMYLAWDGDVIYTVTDTNPIDFSFGGTNYIGKDVRNNQNSGFILDDIVLLEGKALWTEDFTPPTNYLVNDAKWLARLESEGDGIDNNVLLMMHCDDNEFTDSVGNANSATDVNNNVKVNTSTHKFGEGSLELSGVYNGANDYLVRTLSNPFATGYGGLSTEHYTIDFWIYIKPQSSGSRRGTIFEFNNAFVLYYDPTNNDRLILDTPTAGQYHVITVAGSVFNNPYAWNHICIDIWGAEPKYKIRINGVYTSNYAYGSSSKTPRRNIGGITFGHRPGAVINIGKSCDCYIDEFRISSTERWPVESGANFTPPTRQYLRDEGYYTTKSGSWAYLGKAETNEDLISLFQSDGTDVCATQQELEQLGTGVNRPKRACYQDVKYDALVSMRFGDSGLIGTGWTNTGVTFLTEGKFGRKCAHFNNSAYFSGTNSNLNLTGDFTISFWLRSTSTKATQCIIGNSTGGEIVYSDSSRLNIVGPSPNWTRILGDNGEFKLDGNWYHVAITRKGSNLMMFINGIKVNEVASTVSFNYGNGVVNVGQNAGYPNLHMIGDLDDFVIIKDACVWDDTFTVPQTYLLDEINESTPVLEIKAVPKDKLVIPKALLPIDSFEGIDQVNLVTSTDKALSLLHFDGDFTDESGRAWSTVGTPIISSSHGKFGGSSYQLSVENYLTTPNTDFLFGTDNFTIDFQVYADSNTASAIIFRYGPGNTTAVTPFHIYLDAGRIRVYASFNNTSWGYGPLYSPTILLNQFNHVAMVRNGSYVDFYLNGVRFSRIVSSLPFVSTNMATGFPVNLGGFDVSGTVYLDEFRVSKGIARWTDNFTPPTMQSTIDSSDIRFIVTTDLGEYKTFNFGAENWEDINIEDLDAIKNSGIRYDEISNITREKWDELTELQSGIGFAFLLDQNLVSSPCAIDSLSMQVDMKGSWDKAVHGTDYKYGYPKNNLLRVTLLTDGDYKINYSEGQKMI